MVETVDTTENHIEYEEAAIRTAGAPQFKEIVGDMYARWTLDCLVGIAYQVSLDFVRRPEFYKSNITPEVSAQIVRLRIQYGTDVELPDMAQRARD